MDPNLTIINNLLLQRQADLDHKKEELNELQEQYKAIENMASRLVKAEEALEQVKTERDELKDEVKALNMKLGELQKMTQKVVETTEHEDLIKTFRRYLRMSRRKLAKKRGYIKMVVTEIVMSTGLVLPEDMQQELDSFDDEDEKTINIERVNDIHDNDKVEIQR